MSYILFLKKYAKLGHAQTMLWACNNVVMIHELFGLNFHSLNFVINFSTAPMKLLLTYGYYLSTWYRRVVARVAEQLKTSLGN